MQIQASNQFTRTKAGKSLKTRNYEKEYKDCLTYIDSYWEKIIHNPAKKKINSNFIRIPFHFLTANDKKFSYIFYWDSFFIFRGLMGSKREWILKDMVENFAYLFDKYGIIPNFNSHASTNRSQPPFFSSMIFDVYKTFNNGNRSLKGVALIKRILLSPRANFGQTKWLREKINIAKKEYNSVWNNDKLYNHLVKEFGLNRYGDRDIGYAFSSELESGWDFTSRFYNRCNEFLPIDLNSYLYKYEKDFELAASIFGDTQELDYWGDKAKKRKNAINKLMWDENEGFFFDYDYAQAKRSRFYALSGFMPLWAGLASLQQARIMVKKLYYFEGEHGLFITSKESLPPKIDIPKLPLALKPAIEEIIKPKQWDWPSIWPPLEYLTIIGLLRYGFIEDAKRIMEKSVQTQAKIFRKYGTFFERIDGLKADKPAKDGHYEIQPGFGWTNAIFYRYIKILNLLEEKQDIYGFPKEETPPYDLAILH